MFEKYSPMQLRNAIEIELQKTDDAKTAAIIAMKRLNEDPEYYEDMQKAKYIRKLPDGKGGFKYIYKEEKKKTLKEKPTNQTDTKEFKAWFGDSKVVDKNGKPLVVYHGTKMGDFKKFKSTKFKTAGYFANDSVLASAMEQYWAIKTDNKGVMSEWDSGNHPSEDVFKQRLMPLIDKFFVDNDKLLKAIFKVDNKFYRLVG